MKLVVISDTHGQHRSLDLPEGDMIIHAGDLTSLGRENQVDDFLGWFVGLQYRHKVFIAGNHDFFFEQAEPERIRQMIPEGLVYLNDSGIEIEGISLWGSPVTPWFHNWAFNRRRGEEIKRHWDLIPPGIDILVTHGPPFGIQDETVRYLKTGCEDLLLKVEQVRPRYHLFGHIHEAYGQAQKNGTTFVNASILNRSYQIANRPVVLHLEPASRRPDLREAGTRLAR